jgi:hypothetical protein
MSPNSNSSRLFLLSKFFISALVALGVTAVCKAQDKVELYGGYSYFRASVRVVQFGTGTVCPVLVPSCGPSAAITQHANLNGWEFSGEYKFLPFLGAVADFNGNYGTLDGAGTRVHTFLFGPQVSLPARVSPFAHALFGAAKESQDTISVACPVILPSCSGFSSLGSDTSFASAVGAGIDIKLARFLKLRLIQVDYVRTQLHGATQNQPRASAGVVFHF